MESNSSLKLEPTKMFLPIIIGDGEHGDTKFENVLKIISN